MSMTLMMLQAIDAQAYIDQGTDLFYMWGPMLIGLFSVLILIGFIRLMVKPFTKGKKGGWF